MLIPNSEHKLVEMTVEYQKYPRGIEIKVYEGEHRADYKFQRQVKQFTCCLLDDTKFENLKVYLDCFEENYDYYIPLEEVSDISKINLASASMHDRFTIRNQQVEKIMSCYLIDGEDKMKTFTLKKISEEELKTHASK